MRHLTIATPVLGSMDPRVAASLVDVATEMATRGVRFTWDVVMQDACVHRARNTLVSRFLASDSERMLFLDADTMCSVADVDAVTMRDEDLIGGTYAKKSARGAVVGDALIGGERRGGERRGDVLEAIQVGTGFMSISRSCLEQMIRAYPDLAYRAGSSAVGDSGQARHKLFSVELDGGYEVGEDYTFCRRWRAIGGRVWMHTGLSLGHIGSHVYTVPRA